MRSHRGKYIPIGIFVSSIFVFALLTYLAYAGYLYRHLPVDVGVALFQCVTGIPGIALALAIRSKGAYLRTFVLVGAGIWLFFWLAACGCYFAITLNMRNRDKAVTAARPELPIAKEIRQNSKKSAIAPGKK